MDYPLEQFSCGMFQKTTRGIYTWVSDAVLELQQLSRTDIVGKTDHNLPWSYSARMLGAHDEQVLDLRKAIVFKETISRKDHTVKGFCHKSPLYNEQKQLIGVAGIFIRSSLVEEPFFSKLSIREKQCLKNLLRGMTASESAQTLGLSRRTVEGYLLHMREKFHCKNQAELIALAYEGLH